MNWSLLKTTLMSTDNQAQFYRIIYTIIKIVFLVKFQLFYNISDRWNGDPVNFHGSDPTKMHRI